MAVNGPGRIAARERLFFHPAGEFAPVEAHLHTNFTDGEMSPAEAVAAAREQGLAALAFTDHARSESTYVPEYAAVIRMLRAEAPFPVFIGLEVKITDFKGGLDLPTGTELDLVVAVIHRFPRPDGGYYELAPGTAALAAESELRATLGAIVGGRADVIGHPTRIHNTFYREPFPAAYLDEMAAAAARHGVALELNSRSANWRDVLAACRRHRTPVTLGSDAHRAVEVGRMWRLHSGKEKES